MTTDPLLAYPGYVLRRVSAASLAALNVRLEAFELRAPEASVLLVIASNDGITQSQICRMLGMASANLTPIVARLDQRRLIERSALDRRTHGLGLSAAGRTLARRVQGEIEDHERDLLASVPASLRKNLKEALRILWQSQQDR